MLKTTSRDHKPAQLKIIATANSTDTVNFYNLSDDLNTILGVV